VTVSAKSIRRNRDPTNSLADDDKGEETVSMMVLELCRWNSLSQKPQFSFYNLTLGEIGQYLFRIY